MSGRDHGTASSTSTSFAGDTIDRVIDAASGTTTTTARTTARTNGAFVSSAVWRGSRPGYWFGTREGVGTGYHPDDHDHDAAAVATTNGREQQEQEQEEKRPRTGAELLAEAERAQKRRRRGRSGDDGDGVLESTPSGVREATRRLKRSVERNQRARLEHADRPDKFMETELALHEDVSALKDAAASVELYPCLVECGTVHALLGLLAHDNEDVAASVLSVLKEWIDADLLTNDDDDDDDDDDDTENHMRTLLADFQKRDGLTMVLSNVGRLDDDDEDKEEESGIDDLLSVVEALLDMDAAGLLTTTTEETRSVVTTILTTSTFLSWLLDRVSRKSSKKSPRIKSFPTVKSHAAELLASILQHDDAQQHTNDITRLPAFRSDYNDDNTKSSSTMDGMEALLQAVAPYRKKDPSSEDECEYLENCLHALAAVVLNDRPRGGDGDANADDFADAEGPELALRCARERVHAGAGGLRVLGAALRRSRRVAERVVEAGGLRVLFPLLVRARGPRPAACDDAGRPRDGRRRRRRARRDWDRRVEADVVHALYGLTSRLTDDSPRDAKSRLVAKFVENDCEKCDRLVDLCLKYDERMRRAEYRYYRDEEEDDDDATNRDGSYDADLVAMHEKLKGGGDLFHRVGAVCAFAAVESRRCRERLVERLRAKGSGMSLIKAAVEEFASVLDEGTQKEQLKKYLALI